MRVNRRDVLASALGVPCAYLAGRAPAAVRPGGASELKDRLLVLFEQAVAKTWTAGAQLSIVREGKRFDFAAGWSNRELRVPMTTDTIVQIGSTTKVFNAAVVLSLVDESALSLDVPVKRYLPGFRVADAKATEAITLRQLLSMSSGLDNGPYVDFGAGDDSLSRYVDSLGDLPQMFAPGTGFGYSNAGTSIAGHTAEVVAGRGWDELLRERILEPAGLSHAATLERDRIYYRVAVGHTEDGKVIRPWLITHSQAPAGSTCAMSAHDLASFGAVFLNRGIGSTGRRVLSEAACAEIMTPQVDTPTERYGDWCIGAAKANWNGTSMWGHAGGNRSGSSYLYWCPERRGVIAFTTNTPDSFYELTELLFTTVTAEAFGVTRPPIRRPDSPLRLGNRDRFVGKFSGSGFEVSVQPFGQSLRMLRSESFEGRIKSEEFALIALGGDRFLMDESKSREVAFFGDDGQGRATNLIAPLFPLRRISV